MAEARCKERWSHTAALMALIANVNRDPKKTSPYKPTDFNPYHQSRRGPIPKVGIEALKQAFVDQRLIEP